VEIKVNINNLAIIKSVNESALQILLIDKYIRYTDEIIKNTIRIYETGNTTDAKPVITKNHTSK